MFRLGVSQALRFSSSTSLTPIVRCKLFRGASSLALRYTHDSAAPHKKISSKRVAVIGAGKMAEGIIGGLLRAKAVEPTQIVASDTNPDRLSYLKENFDVEVTKDNFKAIKGADLVVLAIKPQTMPSFMPQVFNRFESNALIISIVAGYSVDEISDGTGVRAVVRSMPNTPALVGKSMTVWTCNGGVSQFQKEETQAVLGSFGSELFVTEESYLDMATALSGTGPAYFFMIIEAMIDAGVHIGFPRDVAKMLVLKTVEGTAQLALLSGNHPAHLRNDITSPGKLRGVS